MIVDEIIEEQIHEIINQEKIRSVYQPIISLEDGNIFGYEALSRIDSEQCALTIEELFKAAEELNKLWELEELCRRQSLKNASAKPLGKKLFINVDPNIIYDEEFKAGVTHTHLHKYGLSPEDIIFEITERSAIEDMKTFQKSVNHYKNQDYQIAIDDVGSGYSGLNRICALSPDFLKIDMAIVRDIDKDPIKQSLVESFVYFCETSGIQLIGEGIETEEELRTLVKLKVQYGQGYYIQRPVKSLSDIDAELKRKIRETHNKYNKYTYKPSFFGDIGTICNEKDIVSPKALGSKIYEQFKSMPEMTEICIVDEEKTVLGILTRSSILECFGGKFGYDLHARKPVSHLMNRDFLMLDYSTPIEVVSKMALARPIDSLYNAVVVTQNGKYLGVVTVKELLETAITLQVTRAVDANPLTGLPGNVVIERSVSESIQSEKPFAAIYLDLDNFKAYNDAYGFNNGDLMIKSVANCIRNCCNKGELEGHIGGDDFVIITDYWEVEKLCNDILTQFDNSIESLYSLQDWQNKYIISKNRNGFEERFPIATLSIAVVTNKGKHISSINEFSKNIASVKKKCKQIEGNCIIIA